MNNTFTLTQAQYSQKVVAGMAKFALDFSDLAKCAPPDPPAFGLRGRWESPCARDVLSDGVHCSCFRRCLPNWWIVLLLWRLFRELPRSFFRTVFVWLAWRSSRWRSPTLRSARRAITPAGRVEGRNFLVPGCLSPHRALLFLWRRVEPGQYFTNSHIFGFRLPSDVFGIFLLLDIP